MVVLYRLQALNAEKVRLELDKISFEFDQEYGEDFELAKDQLVIIERQLEFVDAQIMLCLDAFPAGIDSASGIVQKMAEQALDNIRKNEEATG